MTHYYLLEVAGTRQICVLPFSLTIQTAGKEFFTPLSAQEASRLHEEEEVPYIPFHEVESISGPFQEGKESKIQEKSQEEGKEKASDIQDENLEAGERVILSGRCYTKEEGRDLVYFFFESNQEIYVKTVWEEDGRIQVFYTPRGRHELSFSNILTDMLSFENLLLKNQGFLFHCCFIDWNGSAILFTAPSGTGKSTQGDLWALYEGAKVINGDRAGLIKKGDIWTAYGLPYAGSSNIYKNQSAPVKAIVYLSQGKENHVEVMTPSAIMRGVYPELMFHRWDPVQVEKAMGLLTDLIMSIPIYHLTCRPDRGAVDCLKEVLEPGL